MKLSGLLWIGAAGVALVAGIAVHNADEIAHAGEIISSASDHFDEEFDRAEREVAQGGDAEKAYEDAIERALERTKGIDIRDNDGQVRIVVSRDEKRTERVDEAMQRLKEARVKLEERRSSLSSAEFDVAESVLALVEEKLAEEAKEPAE